MDIDWSEAPVWADSIGKHQGGGIAYLGELGYCFIGSTFTPCHEYKNAMYTKKSFEILERRPWTGEGLPPVGLKVEAYFPSDSKPAWLPTVILYASDENVIYSGDEEGEEIRRSRSDFDALNVKFRTIRTAEQIAAEDREQQLSELSKVVERAFSRSEKISLAVYEAGYRKQVQP